MSRTNPFYTFVSHNKYWIVLIVGMLIVGVLDENSFYQRVKNNIQISELKSQISNYNERYEKDEAQLKELRRNAKAITKIARERYFMKADDEDIFVLSDDLTPTTEENETAK
ncbi:MAG: septum formation initiator family protein [Prevotellaceae bacterium]|nr:septum formation initiator family protein [Prevotella sp.]MDD7256900.1 septum formation initiator family protein [Prevotellaceae bacterium]MDY6129842.1 septum formation initiator family protein [Prevotella sp.]